jgi:hypothetical protein
VQRFPAPGMKGDRRTAGWTTTQPQRLRGPSAQPRGGVCRNPEAYQRSTWATALVFSHVFISVNQHGRGGSRGKHLGRLACCPRVASNGVTRRPSTCGGRLPRRRGGNPTKQGDTGFNFEVCGG